MRVGRIRRLHRSHHRSRPENNSDRNWPLACNCFNRRITILSTVCQVRYFSLRRPREWLERLTTSALYGFRNIGGGFSFCHLLCCSVRALRVALASHLCCRRDSMMSQKFLFYLKAGSNVF